MKATGAFEVKLTPAAAEEKGESLQRLLLDKAFRGDLEAKSRGQMFAFRAASEQGSAGYVALEQVSGRLHGKEGTFVLQHSGTSRRGAQQLSVTVVPDSGTGGLTGLSGSMQILIDATGHRYELEYALEPPTDR